MSLQTYPTEPLEPEGLLLVMSSIDLRKWGRGKATAVAFIGAHRGEWVELSTEALRRWIDVGRGYGVQMMGELVDGRVLDRRRGSGGRAHAYRLQPDLMEWGGVPWTVDPELVGHRIAMFHGEHDRAAESADSAVLARSKTARPDVFVARSYTARGSRFVARSRTARERPTSAGFSRGHGPRDELDPSARSWTARETGDAQKRSSLLGGPVGDGPPPRAPNGDEERSITPDEANALRAVQRHARARFIAPRIRGVLLRLLDEHGPAAVVAAVGRCPSDLGLDALAGELELELLATPPESHESRIETPAPPPLVLVEDLDPDAPAQDWHTAAEGVRRARSAMDPLGNLPQGPEPWETPTDAGGAQ